MAGNTVIDRQKVETATYTGNTLSERISASEFCFCQSEEGCPGRVSLCHGDETRKTGGPYPDCFPL